jgi:hypothetical protein
LSKRRVNVPVGTFSDLVNRQTFAAVFDDAYQASEATWQMLGFSVLDAIESGSFWNEKGKQEPANRYQTFQLWHLLDMITKQSFVIQNGAAVPDGWWKSVVVTQVNHVFDKVLQVILKRSTTADAYKANRVKDIFVIMMEFYRKTKKALGDNDVCCLL